MKKKTNLEKLYEDYGIIYEEQFDKCCEAILKDIEETKLNYFDIIRLIKKRIK